MSQYVLSKGVSLHQEQNGATLSVSYPKRLIKLNAAGVQAVEAACHPNRFADKEQLKFAAALEEQGVLTRNFPPVPDKHLPSVSIVIPTYNRPELLRACVESLQALDYPGDRLEIVVVDDASPVPVRVHAKLPLSILRLPLNSGPAQARNAAIQQARGEIIAFLDDDCLASPQWLRELARCFQYPDVAAAGGSVEPAGTILALERYEQVKSPLHMGTEQRKLRLGGALSYLATCNLLVRKKTLQEIGGFNPGMKVGEDVDLCWRILARVENIYYLPAGKIWHHYRSSLPAFLSRRFDYGRSEAKLLANYPAQRRKLLYFPGDQAVLPCGLLVSLLYGLWAGLAAVFALSSLTLFWQAKSRWNAARAGGYTLGIWLVLRSVLRSRGAALYLYCQHFSRYYLLIATGFLVPLYPWLALALWGLGLLAGIVDYSLKAAQLQLWQFLMFHSLENVFYQAGVLMGCFSKGNWRPLSISFIRADSSLLR